MEVLVEFEYSSHEDDELSIKPGDTITDVRKMDGGWWEGSLNGKRGMFPDNFVKEITKKDKVRDPAPLPTNKKSGGSHVASLAKNLGHGGIKMGPPPIQRKAENKVPEKKKVFAKVTFQYSPQHDDELGLEIGEKVEVTKQEEEGWWEGTKGGKSGVFPSNFVELVTEDSSSDEVEKADKEKIDEKVTQDEDVQIIKGKKVKGVGLGDIFGGGPIKLRSTSRDDEAKSDVKAEPKSEAKGRKAAAPPAVKDAPALPPKEVKEAKPVQRAKVLFSYEAENEDELNLEEGTTIVVLEKDLEDSGWWKGEIDGKVGVFPDNFVQILPQEEPRPKKPPPPSLPRETPNKHGRPTSQASTDKHEPPRPPKKDDLKDDKKALGKKQVQAPPPVGKKPLKNDDPKLIAQTDDMKAKEMDAGNADFDGTEAAEKLSHPTADRVRAPVRRPPGAKSRDQNGMEYDDDAFINDADIINENVDMPMIPKRLMTNSNRRPVPPPPLFEADIDIGRSHISDDPTAPENHHHQSSAPNTLPQLKRPNPLQASVHPIPARPRSSVNPGEDAAEVPPIIKEREDKRTAPPRARPPPPMPKEEPAMSPVTSPRSPEPHTKNLVDVAELEAIRKELETLKANTVSRDDYNSLQQDLQHMREDTDKMRSQFNKKVLDLMKEVDEEKKIRLNMQVEMDRVKKLVFREDESESF